MADAKLGWSNKGVKGNVVESVTGDIETSYGKSREIIQCSDINSKEVAQRTDIRPYIKDGVLNLYMSWFMMQG